MSAVAPEVWTKLVASLPNGENLVARVAIPTVTEQLLAAVDADGRRHLLVPLHPNDEELRDTQSRGVTVATRDLTTHEHGAARYLDFECHDAAGHAAFDLIGGDLADALKFESVKPAILGARILAKWRRFWGQSPSKMLSREEQLGLFAELWFLSVWVIPHAGTSKAMDGWRGPLGARHDFEWPGRSVEVKATTSTRGRIHRINGLDQLALPENGVLLFFSLRLREEGGATNTLPGLVASCQQLLNADADALSRFDSALIQIGYSPAHEEEYVKMKFRVVDEALFSVVEGFPRLTQTCFADGVPSGIERVEYEINLSGFEHLRVASSPGDYSFA